MACDQLDASRGRWPRVGGLGVCKSGEWENEVRIPQEPGLRVYGQVSTAREGARVSFLFLYSQSPERPQLKAEARSFCGFRIWAQLAEPSGQVSHSHHHCGLTHSHWECGEGGCFRP